MVNVIEDRDGRILEAALQLAKVEGYQWITRSAVAAAAQVGAGTVNNAYGGMVGLKRAVLTEAVARLERDGCHDADLVRIVAQGMAAGSPALAVVPASVREAVAKFAVAA